MFPKLFQKNNTGKVKEWSISVSEDGTITTKYGQQGGKIVTTQRTIKSGKNIGRANETTIREQALAEAQSKWNAKLDQGYTEHLSTETDHILPMLALDYHKRGKDITFPCYVQPKLDGIRAIYKDGKFYSRKGKIFTGLDHISRELPSNAIIDGELYCPDSTFENIVSIVRNEKGDIDKTSIHYNVFDKVDDKIYRERRNWVYCYLQDKIYTHVVDTVECKSEEDIDRWYEHFVTDGGHEGLMLRNKNGLYRENYRSPDLQKYKSFEDAEYEIVGFKQGTGVEKGCVVWKCVTEGGDEFSVRPRGTHESRKEQYLHGKDYLGKMLTVRYQNLSVKGIPRFPVGIIIRDYE